MSPQLHMRCDFSKLKKLLCQYSPLICTCSRQIKNQTSQVVYIINIVCNVVNTTIQFSVRLISQQVY